MKAKKRLKAKPATRKPAKAVQSSGGAPVRFRALQDFHSDEFQSDYVNGQSYVVREGNAKLAKLAAAWADEGLIEYIRTDAPTPPAIAAGTGNVS